MMMMSINPALIQNDRSLSNRITKNKEQVIGAVMIVEHWSHAQRCRLIERLLPMCNAAQLDMLSTVLQPSLHRDYFYAVKSHFPNYHFKRISTPESRLLKDYYSRCFDREESFYLNSTSDLRTFRDDGGLSRKSQSTREQYTESKSSSSIHCPPIKKSTVTNVNERSQSFSKTLDLHIEGLKKVKDSSQYSFRTPRSVTIQWTEHSLATHSTVSSRIDLDKLLHTFLNSWSEMEQNEFLRRLIVKFDERQQYFTSCVITQRRYCDFISLLPRKIVFQILSYLTLRELSRLREVCKSWQAVINRERELWKPKAKAKKIEVVDGAVQIDWEKLLKQKLATKHNWLAGTARLTKCEAHTERVLCICGNATHLATGALDRTINIWTLDDGKLYQTLTGHIKGVWSVKFVSSTLLVSGGYDATIKIWNIHKGNCLRTILSHSGPVWSLACSNKFCLSGSQDRTGRLWRLPKFELHATFVGHTSSVFGVDLDQEHSLCATASADRTVRLWSLTTTQCIKVLYATTNDYIMSVSLRYGYVAYAFGFHITIYRLNLNDSRSCTVQKIMETHEHRGRIESVQLIVLDDEEQQPSLVSAGQDGLIKFWDFKNMASQHTYNTQTNDIVKINCIYVDQSHIVTVGDDCLVRILNFGPRKHQT